MASLNEGSAVFSASVGKLSKKLPVFYNPVMKLNRDISILLLQALDKKNLRLGLPMAGSGVRGIRFLNELNKDCIRKVYFNDRSEKAVALVRKNLLKNAIQKNRFELSTVDANVFLLESRGFDYIDIDPFGTPVPFLESATIRLSRGGILAVTATDTSALAGSHPLAGRRKYHSLPLKTAFMHETAVRILIRKVQLVGGMLGRAIMPIFSYYDEHYYRVFFRCEKGKKQADKLLDMHGFGLFCSNCLKRAIARDIFNKRYCGCGGRLAYFGPVWAGALWEHALVKKMAAKANGKAKKLLSLIEQESAVMHDATNTINDDALFIDSGKERKDCNILLAQTAFFYHLPTLAKKYGGSIPKIEKLIAALRGKGRRAGRTHFAGQGIRSNAGVETMSSLIRQRTK